MLTRDNNNNNMGYKIFKKDVLYMIVSLLSVL